MDVATGESLRALAIDFKASWKGSIEDGWAMLAAGSCFTVVGGAFLKLGNLGLGFGAEKNEESDFASFTEVTTGLTSFLTTGAFEGASDVTATFFVGGANFEGAVSGSFRFLLLVSVQKIHQFNMIFVE